MLFAHTSDWGSTVLVLLPLAFFAWILHIANRRASERGPADPHRSPESHE